MILLPGGIHYHSTTVSLKRIADLFQPKMSPTVLLISTARFSVGKLLLHHYKSDLAYISDRYSLVIELYLYEMLAKKNKKNKGLVANIRNLHIFELFQSENVWSKST